MAKTFIRLRLGPDRKQNDLFGTPDYPCELYFADLAKHTTGYMPYHWHNEMEYGLVTRGNLLLKCNGKEYIIPENHGFFINTNVLHSMKLYGDATSYYSIAFHGDFLSLPEQIRQKYVDPVMNNVQFPMVITEDKEFISLLKKSIRCYEKKEEGYEFTFYNYVCALWKYVYLNFLPPTKNEEKINQRIREMLQFIAEHYHENIGVDEIAAHVGVSKRECFRSFKNQLNSSPNVYLHQFRMNRAAELLLMTDKKMNEIAKECGFFSAAYFSTKFKNVYGMTPKEYRESMNKNG